ncbi:hexulose-6-phosphate isomerase [Noviherbaspirillum galbum]|uniref:Hexulose-6-phosphate isomerase n=1 Tax=Noviherbaspirillum galbum TaxID=2709383 RepID=A0A6B3SQL6_9BURK|nr:hexulose-6-phosphate isomerase [Noviherbaspirillum galbum]NEX63064.1 hexulose-6-phosphate isomerase [Noviherbaspirillum galbum]
MLIAIFNDPKSAAVAWPDVESLLIGLGARRVEGRKGRVAFLLNDKRADFKRPPQGGKAPYNHLRFVREFLIAAGIAP